MIFLKFLVFLLSIADIDLNFDFEKTSLTLYVILRSREQLEIIKLMGKIGLKIA